MKHQRENNGKFINTYLSSVNATPTAITQTLRSSLAKGMPTDDPLLREFSKNFYNQVGYTTGK